MDNETTIKMPLPPGTIPNQDTVITQPIPVVKPPFPKVQLPIPVTVPLPWHLHVDPIIEMGPPVWDDTPMFDRLYGRRPIWEPEPVRKRKPRYKLQVADYFLVGMGAMVVAGAVAIYGFVTWGWGAAEPVEAKEPVRIYMAPQEPSQAPDPTVTPTATPRPSHGPTKPPEKPRAVVPVAAPTTSKPKPSPTREAIVSPTPRPTASTKPKPSPTPSSSPSASPQPSASSSAPQTPTPSETGEAQDG